MSQDRNPRRGDSYYWEYNSHLNPDQQYNQNQQDLTYTDLNWDRERHTVEGSGLRTVMGERKPSGSFQGENKTREMPMATGERPNYEPPRRLPRIYKSDFQRQDFHNRPNPEFFSDPRFTTRRTYTGQTPTDLHSVPEPPLPPTPSRYESVPAPPRYSSGNIRQMEYAANLNDGEDDEEEEEENDPRLRDELYPESSLNRMNESNQKDVAHNLGSPPKEVQLHNSKSRQEQPLSVSVCPCPKVKKTPNDSPLREAVGLRKAASRSTDIIHCNRGKQVLASEVISGEDKKIEERAEFFRRRLGRESKLCPMDLPSYSLLKEDEATVERNNSVLLPVLEDIEKMFHEAVAAGNVDQVKAFLQDHPDFNINCVNYRKISALHVAVKQQNEAMIEFLLVQRDLDISDCALYAIKTGNVRIVEMILDKIREKSPGLEYAGTTHSVDFADDMTPLILAAQLGKYEMIDFLVKRDHCIPPVHNPFCKCDACRADLIKYDRLRYSTMKLNLYKAISNPMYIFHTTDDPFQRAFELTRELQDAATVFPQFKVSFDGLCQSLRTFTVDLIGCCRNSQEVEIILKKSPKKVADHMKFPRLQYAIDLKQKEFVSHPYTQAVLSDAWTGDLHEWKIRSPLMQSLSVFPRIPMLPVMMVMCIFLPSHSLVRKWKTPVNKMISSVASYLIFLVLLFLESNLDKRNQKRGPPNSGLEGIIFVFVIGYIWLSVRTCFRQGVKRFFSTMWHWYDTIMLFLFFMTMVFWIASLVDVKANNDVDLPRKYWNSMDPELIAEGFFAAAVIMAFFRLNLFLSLNYHLGPLQVSIGKMTLDIFRFIIIFFVIILAWCAGLCRFYQPYEGMVQKDYLSGTTTTQVSSFVNFFMTLKTFFWAIFGMSPIESADVVIENLPGDTPDVTIINKHQFTETVGYIAFACGLIAFPFFIFVFQFLSVVVVLNMLVACMANTFTKVIDNVTVEWVFGRSQIYLSFMASSVLPPPFNLVPTASGIKDMFLWFRLLAKPCESHRAKCSMAHCCYIESDTEAYVNNEFPSLMSDLAQRYIQLKEDAREEEEKKNGLEDIRNDVSDTKELLRKFISVTPQAGMMPPTIGRRGILYATQPYLASQHEN